MVVPTFIHTVAAWIPTVAGDTLTVVFDLATNRGGGGATTTAVPVDDMLTFSHSLGADARASWMDDSTLVVTVGGPHHAATRGPACQLHSPRTPAASR